MAPTDGRLSRLKALLEEFYFSPYRGALARARRDEDDVFMLLVYAELMGIPNPATYYTLELQPFLLERFPRLAQAYGDGALAAGPLPVLLVW